MDLGGRRDNSVAFVFPGQGSQYVGMGRDLYEASPAARQVFEEAEDALGVDLPKLCFEGPEDVLQDTINAQPAVLTVSIACLEALRERWQSLGINVVPRFTAGHSLGQYSALVAAGSLQFREAVQLVRERGRLMKESGEAHPGGMAAVIGLDASVLESLCQRVRAQGIVCPANFNSPVQTVISGELAALSAATQLALAEGARRVVQLAVSIAAHSPLMQRAAEQFAEILARFAPRDARVPVISNVTAQALTSAEAIQADLAAHIIRSVRWVQSVREMVGYGVTAFVEIGPGQVLAGLIRGISQDVSVVSIGDLKSLQRRIPLLDPSTNQRRLLAQEPRPPEVGL